MRAAEHLSMLRMGRIALIIFVKTEKDVSY